MVQGWRKRMLFRPFKFAMAPPPFRPSASTARSRPSMRARICRKRVGVKWLSTEPGALCPHDEPNIAIENLKKRDELVDRLGVVGLIEEPVELRCRYSLRMLRS